MGRRRAKTRQRVLVAPDAKSIAKTCERAEAILDRTPAVVQVEVRVREGSEDLLLCRISRAPKPQRKLRIK